MCGVDREKEKNTEGLTSRWSDKFLSKRPKKHTIISISDTKNFP